MEDEFLEIVNDKGEVIAIAPRSEVHGNPALTHRVVHVLVFNKTGELLLQKRSMKKDVAPGRWDTSVGGHVDPGETLLQAATRELKEELGIESQALAHLYSYKHSNAYETELVNTYLCKHDGVAEFSGVTDPSSGIGPSSGPFSFNTDEIDEVRFWPMKEIMSHMEGETLSDNFKDEIKKYLSMKKFKQ